MDIEVQFQQDGEPDGDWHLVHRTYLHPEIRQGIELLLERPYVTFIEITYNTSVRSVLSSKFRKQPAVPGRGFADPRER
jgi:hypothetical protein